MCYALRADTYGDGLYEYERYLGVEKSKVPIFIFLVDVSYAFSYKISRF